MRKLDDAAKLSIDTLGNSISILRYPPTRSGNSEINNHRFNEFFNLHRPARVDLRRRRLLDILIHSLVLVEVLGDAKTYDAFMLTSDREQARGLLQVEVSVFIKLMRLAANDFPTVMRRTRNSATGNWQIWTGHDDLSSDA